MCAPPTDGIVIIEDPAPSLLDLSSFTDESLAPSAPQFPKPKRKQIRSTASDVQQRHIDDLKAKRHKSDAHKAAVRLYDVEKQKPNGMSVRKVLSVILAKFEVCPSRATIACYTKHGLVNTSPMKMGPTGLLLAMAYKFLCHAYLSLIPINQMNACAGDNSRKKMIPMLAKTFNIGTIEATGLLNRVVCYTATNINAVKLNCAEDRRIRWTTYQNLDLWFDSWEVFLVDYGFATVNTNGELVFDIEMIKRILNLDETCMLLDGGNGNRGGRPTVTYYDVCFPQLGKATSKSALTRTMIGGSNAAGEPIPPHFQFQRSAQTPDAKALRIECIRYMLNVQAAFGHEEVQSFPIPLGLNNKGGMDDVDFFEYLQINHEIISRRHTHERKVGRYQM